MRFILLLFFAPSLIAQVDSCQKVWLKGSVVDSIRPKSFYNLMVINKTSGQGVFGNPGGSFSVYVNPDDSVVLSVQNYPKIGFRVHADSNCQFVNTFYLESPIQWIEEVRVKPLKSLQAIKEERAALALRETRMVTGINVLQSPITALYQAFSKTERNKRWISEQNYANDQRRIVKELLRLYVSYDIIELDDDEFDRFIVFLNIDPNFLKTASEMELINFIQGKYEHYQKK